MRTTNYILFRYEMIDEDGDRVGARLHHEILDEVKGRETGYRGDDSPSGRTNILMRLRQDNICGEHLLTFDVGYKIKDRLERRWESRTDEYQHVSVRADDLIFTSFILSPRMGVVAAKDGSGNHLSALSGMGRLRSIVRAHSDVVLRYQKSAEPADVDRAMRTFRLTEFSFDVRPFNPHPHNPGERLDELMKEAGVGRFKGIVKPSKSSNMKPDEDGIIAEAVGLARAGYGQFALKAETGDGAKLSYAKPAFNENREQNELAAGRPRMLKVTVPDDDLDMTEQEHVLRVMLDLFDDKRRPA